ncbi:MAG: HD-GYP domain-containing protein [Candidatus Saccharibacteria bacterium]
MERIRVEDLLPGMLVGRTVLHNDGRVLLQKNTVLTLQYITSLKKMGFGSVYVKNSVTDIDIPEVISVQAKAKVTKALNRTAKTLQTKGSVDPHLLDASVSLIISDILANPNVLMNIEDIRCYEDYLFGHCISVCTLALMTAINMGYRDAFLKDLGIGALLHDIGMTLIDPAIINKTGALSDAEMNTVKQHTNLGYNVLKSLGEVDATCANVAFQHHERWSGGGYPRSLSGHTIMEYARITAIADVFDAMISDRPYRPGRSLSDVMTILDGLSGDYFDPEILNIFRTNIAPYPTGTLVKLNTDEIAMVLMSDRDNPFFPQIKIIIDKVGKVKPVFEQVDLSTNNNYKIIRQLDEKESKAILPKLRLDGSKGK